MLQVTDKMSIFHIFVLLMTRLLPGITSVLKFTGFSLFFFLFVFGSCE